MSSNDLRHIIQVEINLSNRARAQLEALASMKRMNLGQYITSLINDDINDSTKRRV